MPAPGPILASPFGKLAAFDGVSLRVSGLKAGTGALCRIGSADAPAGHAVVTGFRDEDLLLMPLDNRATMAAGMSVSIVRHRSEIGVGDGLIGRAIDDSGVPVDGGGPVRCAGHWPLMSEAVAAVPVTEPLATGIRSIDAALTIGAGQRIGLIAPAGAGKTSLVERIAAEADVDIVILALIGERGREVSGAIRNYLRTARRDRTIIVAVPADRTPLRRLRGADRAVAIAEYFRDRGRRVLLVVDSLTRLAHAQREVGLAMGEPPATRGYPPSVFGLIPRLVERAGAHENGGSITGIYTVLAEDGDHRGDPVVESAMAILDGHIVLTREQAALGIYPAIDLTQSISRIMDDIVPDDQMRAARHLRRLLQVHRDNRDLLMLGGYQPGTNPDLDMAIEREDGIRAFLAQHMSDHVAPEAAVAAMIDLVGTA
ncbi:MAG: FliI/YscN family ATPase [Pseudomonadota bacterium]